MSSILSGRSGFFAFLIAILFMVVSVVYKYINMTSITPGRVSHELDQVFSEVGSVRPMSLLKAEFLMEWGEYRSSERCSEAVSASTRYSGDGFQGDHYVVTYQDSIEFPGITTLRQRFSIEKKMEL